MTVNTLDRYKTIVDEIGNMNWSKLSREELTAACCAYYYFSVQFVECVDIACELYPADAKLIALREGECDTDNLSPYPGIAKPGERMNHDEFMRRVVVMAKLDPAEQERLEQLGRTYFAEVHPHDPVVRAMSLSSYEDGGLETVFRAILKARDWDSPALRAFHHFLVAHIELDSGEHGGLCRHLVADDRVAPLWSAFRNLLVRAAPRLAA
jgi:hypothetical protein